MKFECGGRNLVTQDILAYVPFSYNVLTFIVAKKSTIIEF